MRKGLQYFFTFCMANILSLALFAQSTTITGNVRNTANGGAVSSASVTVRGSGAGTVSDEKGNFTLTINQKLPVTLTITSVGFEPQDITVSSPGFVQVNLTASNVLGQEVVVAATRTPSRILESPVTIERVNAAAIANAAVPSYYDIVGKLKGVDVVTASLLFTTPTTRGFAGSGNLRLNQLVDGMDNQAPGLNFALGSVVGLTQLDVESIELLQGASSALYGPGGMNGAILINGKDPFRYQGLSLEIKTGVMHVDDRSSRKSPYYNWSVRYAKQVTNKLAFKVTTELIQAKDWIADDYRNYKRVGTTGFVTAGTRDTDPNYDGVNVYGDETTIDIKSAVLNSLGQSVPFYAPYINALGASIPVSRTGYLEKQVLNPNTVNFKLGGQVNYRIKDKTTAILEGFWGTGNTIYTGSDRYSLKNLKMGQYKIELNNPNWFLRAWTTQENAGESFNATVTTRLFNEAWKPSGGANGWYYQYSVAFLQNKIAGQSDLTAHNNARAVADVGRPAPGSAQFQQIFDQVRKVPISKGGGLFVDKTNLYSVEGQYNLSQYTNNFADILVGGNYKKYVLNSEGTLFADSAGTIGISEVGAYVQATKRFLEDKLKIIASGRYDKNENFDGRFTPRISAVISLAKDNNLRLSYQQAYRFPSTQQQWINLRVGGGTRLLGGLVAFQEYYKFGPNPVYDVTALQTTNTRTVVTFPKFKAETVNSFEGGYKGLMLRKKLLVDLYGYYGIYADFITRTLVAQSVRGNANDVTAATLLDPSKVTIYSVPTNVSGDVKTYGFGISLDYSLPANFSMGATASSDRLSDVPANYQPSFNAPKYRAGAYIRNSGIGTDKRIGFSLSWRWQDDVNYQGDFASGEIPAFHNVDAMISYKFPAEKMLLKLGATNLLNEYYRNGFGNSSIGGLYYVSFAYNVF